MPMSFPDMDSLIRHAKRVGFREPLPNEPEGNYRQALAQHVEPMDYVESCEIRNKVGWDQFNDVQKLDMVVRRMR